MTRRPSLVGWKVVVSRMVDEGRIDAVAEALSEFWRQVEGSSAESRTLFDAAVIELTDALLRHARPAKARLNLSTSGGRVRAGFMDPGRGWLGAERERLLEDLMASGGALAAARPVLDEMRYEPESPFLPGSHYWFLIMSGSAEAPAPATGVRRIAVPRPARQLARAASRIAADQPVKVPHTDRGDEYGVLARALRTVQEVSVARGNLVQHAPVGITRTGTHGVVVSVNQAAVDMYGYQRPEDMVGRYFTELIHPDDSARDAAKYLSMVEGREDHYEFERRGLRADGSSFWSRATVAPVRRPDGEVEGYISMIDDISDRKRQTARAARVQQQLLPQSTPRLDGYELAGRCLAAKDVAGDFYDWVLTDDGHLDLTLADVMGKGFGAAMVMATLRTALRLVPRELGPAERASLAASSMALTLDESEGLFVTLFQARLHLASGRLRYLDAGHGHWAIRRPSGELVKPRGAGALPLFVMPDWHMEEGEAQLEPGDALLLYSDGLVEVEDEALDITHYGPELDEASDAEDMVARLMAGTPAWLGDDVTIVVVRRLPAAS